MFEVGGHDGAYNGRIHVIVPLVGRKNGTLTARQQCYHDVHCRTRPGILGQRPPPDMAPTKRRKRVTLEDLWGMAHT